MIELELLKNVTHIVTHENCADGTSSAMILRDVLPNAKVTFCQYSTKLHDQIPAEPGMLFCDFSPPLKRVQEFLDVKMVVLDHHGGPAKESTLAFAEKGLGAFADEKTDPGVSGAMLAYNEVWVPLDQDRFEVARATALISGKETLPPSSLGRAPRDNAMRSLATLAGIRDTWQKGDALWDLACATAEATRWWPWYVVEGTPWNKWADELFKIGPLLMARNMKTVDKCIEGAYRFTTGKGRQVTVFEGLKPSSDAAEKLGETNDLTIGLGFLVEDGHPKMIFSTRGRGTFHCRNFAMAHGGGGHVKAAGFSVPLFQGTPQPYELARQILVRYESVEDEWAALTAEPDFDKRVKNGEIVPQQLFASLLRGGPHAP
jgi:hypothetical protein